MYIARKQNLAASRKHYKCIRIESTCSALRDKYPSYYHTSFFPRNSKHSCYSMKPCTPLLLL